MINLLPLDEKKNLRREQLVRYLIVLFLALIIGIIVGSTLLIPSFVISKTKIEQAQMQLARSQNSALQTEQASQAAAFAIAQQKIDVLIQGSDRLATHKLIADILNLKPNGVTLSGIVYRSTESGTNIILSGNAATRESLKTLALSLESDALFSEVVLPVSNLAKESDILFTLTLTVGQKNETE